MSIYTPINLATLPAPDVVEPLSFETIFSEMLADLKNRDSAFTALVESDPAYKVLEVAAYRELLVRQRVNDAGRSVMLAYAAGSDLEQLGALFGVTRKTLVEANPNANPPVVAVYERDSDLRLRIQLSLEGLSTAGPSGAYVYHALKVTTIRDVSVESPTPGNVLVTVLSQNNNGLASAEEVAAVNAILSSDDVRPLTDNVTVQAAEIVTYAITATVFVNDGPDSSVVLANCISAANDYAAERFSIGSDINLSGIYAALHQPGVEKVVLTSPLGNLDITPVQAGRCTAVTLTLG
jgi:phage-related baseplate assembly protein